MSEPMRIKYKLDVALAPATVDGKLEQEGEADLIFLFLQRSLPAGGGVEAAFVAQRTKVDKAGGEAVGIEGVPLSDIFHVWGFLSTMLSQHPQLPEGLRPAMVAAFEAWHKQVLSNCQTNACKDAYN